MKTLFLLRHAKSDPPSGATADFQRSLNERGLSQAEAVGRFLLANGIDPDSVVSSPAIRATETTERVIRSAGLTSKLHNDSRIYEASRQQLLEVIREFRDEVDSVVLVGHNPGIEELAQLLSATPVPFGTAGLAKITLSINRWSEVSAGTGTFEWIEHVEK